MSDSGNGKTPHLWIPNVTGTWRPGVRHQQQTEHIDALKLKRFEEFGDLLNQMGLQLVCSRCTKIFGPGMDGVRANNDPAATELVLECGCTRRVCKVA